MPIHETKSARAIVIAPWHIYQLLRSFSPNHIANKAWTVDAVFMLVQQYPCHGWSQNLEV